MDLATIIGMSLSFILIGTAMMLGVGVGPYIDIPSALITIGGSITSLFIGYKMENMKKIFSYFLVAFKPQTFDVPALVKKLVDYSTQARRDGILSLEQQSNQEENDFLKRGLNMAIDGAEPDSIRSLLETDLDRTLERHKANAGIFDTWAAYAGAYGMLGTLIGLVAMLLNMSDPSSIGPAMAVALITTLYGSMVGNIVGAPIANILNVRANDEALVKLMIIEGIMSIQAGDNPRSLEAKLLTFLPPNQRVSQFE
ncbi:MULTISPECIES: motility protein A [Helicobacter]|uniref:Motility protein A n=1 Tax=Helicobacter colisuis TaxID=2949739 RepID=A0ABT0TRR5_9HELI|nr:MULTISPECIES: motility protein A [Helicobacter]MCI2236161.1 motility protein A [Helicobacter sp. CaF467b]MCI7046612.1 motility protein A [Helicobacter sp.]MCI7765760.1 motility protein A [Helicobacter sp.]MCL9818613.1 motility protein A [Helicobacter colisuis]MCL9820359.1 motility protein A [Helicobacter colisuis]